MSGHPFFERRQHLLFAALLENATGFFPLEAVHRGQLGQQRLGAQFCQIGFLNDRTSLVRNAPDAAMNVVTAFVAEIDFAVLNDRVRPVGDIKRAVRSHLHVDRAKGDARRTQHIRHLLRNVGRALFADVKTNDAVRPEVAGDRIALPVVGEVLTANQFQATEFRVTPRADACQQLGRSGVGEVHRARHGVAQTLPARAIGHERLAKRVVVVTPRIAETAQENFTLQRLRAHPPDTAAFQPQHLVRRFHVGANVNRLIKIQPPVESPAQRVQDVMRVLGAKPGCDHLAFVRLAVAVGVLEMQQFRALPHVHAAVSRLNAGRDQQVVREHSRLVRLAVVVGVLQNDHLIGSHLAGKNLWVHLRTGHPQPAPGIKVHLDRLGQVRVLREELDLQPVSEVKLGQRLRLE